MNYIKLLDKYKNLNIKINSLFGLILDRDFSLRKIREF